MLRAAGRASLVALRRPEGARAAGCAAAGVFGWRLFSSSSAPPSPAEEVRELVAAHDVMVFSKSTCPFCALAKQTLGAHGAGVPFHAVELNEREDGQALQEALLDETGQRTVPNIFINGRHVGGASELVDAQRSGRLDELLRATR